jgi:uncharacterized protein (TIGR02246 family)
MNVQPAPNASADLAAIRQILADLAACWNRADGAAYGALFTDDADYIDVTGTRTRGGAAIGRVHQFLWDGFLKGSVLDTDGEHDIQLITPDVAIVIATGAARLAGQATAPADRQSINTTVLLKRAGVWRIRAFQNGRVQPFGGKPS